MTFYRLAQTKDSILELYAFQLRASNMPWYVYRRRSTIRVVPCLSHLLKLINNVTMKLLTFQDTMQQAMTVDHKIQISTKVLEVIANEAKTERVMLWAPTEIRCNSFTINERHLRGPLRSLLLGTGSLFKSARARNCHLRRDTRPSRLSTSDRIRGLRTTAPSAGPSLPSLLSGNVFSRNSVRTHVGVVLYDHLFPASSVDSFCEQWFETRGRASVV